MLELNFTRWVRLLSTSVALCSIGTTVSAKGSYQDAVELRLVEEIVVDDVMHSVDDGCLPDPSALKLKAEATLSGKGISVTSKNLSSRIRGRYGLSISAVGYEVTLASDKICVVGLNITLVAFVPVEEGRNPLALAYDWTEIQTSPKTNIQGNVRSSVADIVSDLVAEIQKARAR